MQPPFVLGSVVRAHPARTCLRLVSGYYYLFCRLILLPLGLTTLGQFVDLVAKIPLSLCRRFFAGFFYFPLSPSFEGSTKTTTTTTTTPNNNKKKKNTPGASYAISGMLRATRDALPA